MSSIVPRRLLALTLILVTAALVVVGWRTYVTPTAGQLRPGEHVDAVLALGGPHDVPAYAIALAEQGRTPVLVLSDPYGLRHYHDVDAACASKPANYRVICFVPDPPTTRGEAEELGRLARENGWQRVAVIAPTYQISRGRLRVERCFGGDVLMLRAPGPVGLPTWAYQFAYQTAGFARAAVERAC